MHRQRTLPKQQSEKCAKRGTSRSFTRFQDQFNFKTEPFSQVEIVRVAPSSPNGYEKWGILHKTRHLLAMRVPLRRSSPPETDKPSRFAANRSPRLRSTRTPRDSRRSIPGRSVPDTIFQSAFGVLDALLQPAFGNLPLQPFATMVGPQRPSCRIQFPLSVPETLGANLNAPAHARSRLVGHAAHLTAIAQLPCRHRYHLVAIGLQCQPLRGISSPSALAAT